MGLHFVESERAMPGYSKARESFVDLASASFAPTSMTEQPSDSGLISALKGAQMLVEMGSETCTLEATGFATASLKWAMTGRHRKKG